MKDIGPEDILIDYITTSREHRGKGIGTQMVAFVRDELNHKRIQLETYSKNTEAIAFYERLGFRTTRVDRSMMMRLTGYGDLITMRFEAE